MMSHMETYTMELRTCGPLFIGAGYGYGKKEVIYDLRNKKVHIPDMKKMYVFLQKKNLMKQYEQFMLGREKDFSYWLFENRIGIKEYMPWISYTLDGKESDLGNSQVKEIASFVKDPYGLPYVPGSSLKGAIRTILLGSEILENKRSDREYQKSASEIVNAQFIRRKNYLNREMKNLEAKVFYTRKQDIKNRLNAVNDVMSGIRISDSLPLHKEDLILCQKIDVTKDGETNRLPILRECIRPDTKITFKLTIDKTITSITVEQLRKAIAQFLNCYNRSFDNLFSNSDNYEDNVIYLGGGSGFVSKTILYPLLGNNATKEVSRIIDNTLSPSGKKQHKHWLDSKKGVSPHMIKKTIYGNSLMSFGACEITFV